MKDKINGEMQEMQIKMKSSAQQNTYLEDYISKR